MLRKSAIVIAVLVGVVVGGSVVWTVWRWGEGGGARAIAPGEAPGEFDPGLAGERIEVRRIGGGAGYWVQQTDPQTGRLIREFRYDKLDPEAEGQFNVANPEARLYLDGRRVVRMRAATGRLVAPDRMPRQGRFSDGVTIEVFGGAPGVRPRVADDSPDLLFTVELNEARFNTMLGKIDSEGPVTLRSAEARFAGRGLTLVYDDQGRRIEYMRIDHGDYLEYRPGPGADLAVEGGGVGDAAGPRAARLDVGPTPDGAGGAVASTEAAAPYYRARFEQSVVVRHRGRVVEADVLDATFALAGSQGEIAEEQLEASGGSSAGSGGAGDEARAGADAARRDGAAGDEAGGGDGGLLTLHWSGPLVMEPLAEAPARLSGPDDALLVFEGEPLRMRDGQGGRLVGERAEYQRSRAAVSAVGSASHPLRVASETLGELSCVSVDLSLATGIGKLWGDGRIVAAREPGEGAGDERGEDSAGASGLPPGFSVRWSERVDLAFAAADEKPGGLKAAQFIGDVEVEDRRFSMTGQRLAVGFEVEGPGAGRRLSAIEAHASRQAEVEAEADAEPVRFESREGEASGDRFVVELAEGEGGPMPRRLQAWGRVRMADASRSIAADRLDVRFRPRRAGSGQGDAAAGVATVGDGGGLDGASFEVASVEAEGGVRLREADGSWVEAGRLRAESGSERVELWGEPMVTASREGALLRVPRLSLREGGGVAAASGGGEFAYQRAPDREGDGERGKVGDDVVLSGGDAGEGAGRAERQAVGAAERLDVRWAGDMRYVEADSLLTVEGEVVAVHRERADQANRLEAERLALELVRPGGRATGGGEAGEVERTLLERMVAERNVVVQSTRWADGERKKVLGRLRIAGPRLTFDNATERAVVEGAGSMLIEDYTKAEGRRELGQTRLSGRGKTLFTWLGRLVMDGSRSDVIVEGGSNMTHKAAEGDRVVDIQAHRLVADMAGVGGIEAMRMSGFEDLRIDKLVADRDVEIRDGERIVTAGHVEYAGAAGLVMFEAPEGGMVEVIRMDEPRPIRAKRVRWDLGRDRVEVVEGGY